MYLLEFAGGWVIQVLDFHAHTLRRKNTDTFASVCSKMAIFKRLENYPKDMQNSLSFHLLIGHIGEASE